MQAPEEFYAARETGKRRRECRTCVKEYVAKWQRRNKEKFAQYVLAYKLKSEFGITIEDRDRMLVEQNGLCAICKAEPHPTQGLAVDHCHDTGRVRGLLCHKCNRGIGYFKDSPERLRRAAAYLNTAS
ncbi:endonuclease VII domain-containing protein [Streptomyces noursei]|uniref:endonuclease VII domain-containing protein n=1 Tax=Streptomyces noursei TaxID=1971 RepID=UPI0035DF326C